jgi:uncharacterized protein YjbJ (UPF0337 family)
MVTGRGASENNSISGTAPPLEEFNIESNRRHEMVDKDRIKGAAQQAKGKAKEWTGKTTGDKKTEVEGKADQVKGKAQNAVGGAKDVMRGK